MKICIKELKQLLIRMMRQVEANAKGYVPSNAEVLSGWSKPISSDINYRPFPKYDSNNVRGGIGYKEGQNRRLQKWFPSRKLCLQYQRSWSYL
jgi:hypothetical protein